MLYFRRTSSSRWGKRPWGIRVHASTPSALRNNAYDESRTHFRKWKGGETGQDLNTDRLLKTVQGAESNLLQRGGEIRLDYVIWALGTIPDIHHDM